MSDGTFLDHKFEPMSPSEVAKKLDFVDVLYCTREQKEKFNEKIEDLKLYNPTIKIIETL